MTEISIDGRSYNAIPIHSFDGVYQHPFVKPLNLKPGTLAWLRPESLHIGERTKKRPLTVLGLNGQEVIFVDRNCELVLCIDKDLHPKHTVIQEKRTLRTSDTRKNALRLAYELYEHCSGNLKHSLFDVDEGAKQLGFPDEEDAEGIFSYLTSTNIMESPYIGAGRTVRFTGYGISVVEAGIDRPDTASGPFPPLNIVVGDIGAGAQVAIGAGTFHQDRKDTENSQVLRDLLPLLQAASTELRASGREQEATLLTTAENEVGNEDCDKGYLKATLGRFAKTVGNKVVDAAAGAASQAVLAYCKAHGLLP
jgi:hypothetical protein